MLSYSEDIEEFRDLVLSLVDDIFFEIYYEKLVQLHENTKEIIASNDFNIEQIKTNTEMFESTFEKCKNCSFLALVQMDMLSNQYSLLANALFNLGNYDEAEHYFNLAILIIDAQYEFLNFEKILLVKIDKINDIINLYKKTLNSEKIIEHSLSIINILLNLKNKSISHYQAMNSYYIELMSISSLHENMFYKLACLSVSEKFKEGVSYSFFVKWNIVYFRQVLHVIQHSDNMKVRMFLKKQFYNLMKMVLTEYKSDEFPNNPLKNYLMDNSNYIEMEKCIKQFENVESVLSLSSAISENQNFEIALTMELKGLREENKRLRSELDTIKEDIQELKNAKNKKMKLTCDSDLSDLNTNTCKTEPPNFFTPKI